MTASIEDEKRRILRLSLPVRQITQEEEEKEKEEAEKSG